MARRIDRPRNPQFGAWLASQLRRTQMNQSEFAAAAGVSTSAVSRWVHGHVPEAPYCDRIADALHLDVDTVLLRAGHRQAPDGLALSETEQAVITLLRRADLTDSRVQLLFRMLEDWIDRDRHP